MRAFARRVARHLAPHALAPLWLLEQVRLAKIDPHQPIEPPPIFIIGAPRTGSTLIYQALTNGYQVSYISNLSGLFVRSLWLGERLHRWLYRDEPHASDRSAYGRTDGFNAPSESGKFWYRWFPSDRHFVTAAELDPSRLTTMRRTVAAIVADAARPMVFKNLNCGQRLQVLRHVLPEALFLVVVRDPLATACSLLRGRIERSGSKEAWFSVMPRNVVDLKRLPYPLQVVRQVHELERQMEVDLELFPPGQSLWIRYEDFCAEPIATMERIACWAARNGAELRPRAGAQPLSVRQPGVPTVDTRDREAMAEHVRQLSWVVAHRDAGPEALRRVGAER